MTKVLRQTATSVEASVGASTEQILAEGMVPNRAGGAAFKLDDRAAVLSYLTTGGVGNTYYASKSTLDTEARNLFVRATIADPTWFAKALIYARERGLMRSAPITGLVTLSTGAEGAHRAFHAAFPRVIQTPGDLADFWTQVRGVNKSRGVGRSVRTATANWFEQMSAYHAIKYGAESQSMSLRDIYRMTHAKLTGFPAGIASYVVKGVVTDDTPEQLRGYHEFKNATADIDTLLGLVEKHRLPWEVVAPQIGNGDAAEKKQVWMALANQMPYMALLRSLNNLIKYGVLNDTITRVKVLGKLSDPNNVAHSKQFPFRFISAIRAVEGLTGVENYAVIAEVVEALKTALNHSVSNMPKELGHTLTVLDVSGSMSCEVSGRNHTAGGMAHSSRVQEGITCVDIGAIFAAALFKGAETGDIMTFDTSVRWETSQLSRSMGIYDIAHRINHRGGGTALSEPLKAAFTSPKKYDSMVFFTDSESWVNEMNGSGSYWGRRPGTNTSSALLKGYQQSVNPAVKTFFVQLVPTQTQIIAPDIENTYFISGWSNSVLDYITLKTSQKTESIDQIIL